MGTRSFSSTSQRGAAVKGLLTFLFLISLIVVGVAYCFGYVVPPGSMGVRQIRLGPTQGFSDVALPPGYHWSIPFYSTIHLIPQTVQLLSMHRDAVGGEDIHSRGSLEIQATDGSSVFVDVSLLYHFYTEPEAGKHGGPRDLITKLGTQPQRWVNQIEADSSNRLKAKLGELSTSEFYDPVLREQKITEALEEIKSRVNMYGIALNGVLVRRYTYTDDIDSAIFQKNLQEQEERLNQAKSKFAEAHAEVEKVTATGDTKIKNLRVEGENKVRVFRSEGDLYETQKRAEADLLVAKARAEVDRLRAGALATSVGANIYVGRELAPLLTSLQGGIVTGVDPYNIDSWMERFGLTHKQ